MNRLCPDEEKINNYVYGLLNKDDTDMIEKHLIKCKACRETVIDVTNVIHKFDFPSVKVMIIQFCIKNIWFILSLLALTGSFIIKEHFLQCLLLSLLLGIKWISSSVPHNLLIMIQENLSKRKSTNTNTKK